MTSAGPNAPTAPDLRTHGVPGPGSSSPGSSRGWIRELALFGFYLLAAVVLTWPIAISLNDATGIRGDYFNNAWNGWWVRRAITEGHSPWFTELLYHPAGLSLTRHTLSPINSALGAFLGAFMGPHAAFNVQLLLIFAVSAWAFSLFARYLTRSWHGGVLAGLIYSFNPFHYYYLCQVNVFTFEFVPLALLYFLKTYREGGRRNLVLAVVFSGAIAASTSYYVVYAYLVVGLMLAAGPLVDREVPWAVGARRTLVAAFFGGLAVCAIAAPLLIGALQADPSESEFLGVQKLRTNDLLGYFWLGGPERTVVTWPALFGYSTLALILVFAKRLWRLRFWLLVGLVFFVLGLGEELVVARDETGIPMPYAVLKEIPVLSMLRKSDRCTMMLQFVVALFAAEAWKGLAGRVLPANASSAGRTALLAAVSALVMLELTAVPFQRFDYDVPEFYRELAEDDSVDAIVELPPMPVDVQDGRQNFYQTVHGKPIAVGYSTMLARDRAQDELRQAVVNGYIAFMTGRTGTEDKEPFRVIDPQFLMRHLHESGFDLLVLYKSEPLDRKPNEAVHEKLVWKPFFFERRNLVGMRQTGQYVDQPIPASRLTIMRSRLQQALGPPFHEDDDLLAWRLAGG